MRPPKKPNEKNLEGLLQTERDDLLQAFSAEIIHGNVVLLLGHESLLRVPTDEEVSQNKYLKDLQDCKGSMERWMNYLKDNFYTYQHTDRSLKEFYADWFDNKDNNINLDWGDINTEIKKLLKTKQIRVVLTTTYDPLIEELMEEIWGQNSYDVKNFLDGEDIPSLEKNILKDDIRPTLYYLFGKATKKRADACNYGNPDFVLDEEDYIKTLKKWMVKPPSNLMSYIYRKRILAIGCKFDYWLFRFFWRVVLEAEKSPIFKHLLAITLTSTDSDNKLREIFNLYKLKFPEDVNEFLKELNITLERQIPILFTAERRQGGIFLSYCRKDKDKVLNLFYKLKEEGFKVWMDTKELLPGEDYRQRINDAIENCTVFVPILSDSIANHEAAVDPSNEKDANYHFYRDYEWNIAQLKYENDRRSKGKNNKLEIIPFAFEGFNIDSIKEDVKQLYPKIMDQAHIELSYSNATFAKFIAALNKAME